MSFFLYFSIIPSGCTDVINSNTESAAQSDGKDEKMDRTAPVGNKDEPVEKTDKSEKPDKPNNKLQNTTYIFTRYAKNPAVVIPSVDHFTTAVRCCPTIFKLRPHDENCPPIIDLPYRMIYAVASKTSVYLYDTQQRMPFGSISKIHYARLTDVAWSSDGKILIASSFDGFCTLIAFEDGELGEVYDQPIKMTDTDDKENQTKKKRNSNEAKTKTSPKEQKTGKEQKIEEKDVISTKEMSQVTVAKPIIEIPETIIASVETFESPEYKEKQATPIAIRRAPRTNPSTPSSANTTPSQSETESSTKSSKQPKLIAVRRQPRNILPSPVVMEKSATDQDEALDAWPIPIDSMKNDDKKVDQDKNDEPIIISDDTENMHLVYEGDSELTLIKTETIPDVKSTAQLTSTSSAHGKTSEQPSSGEQPSEQPSSTPDAKNPKTPRRVQLRTISTPKSKKKLIN